MDNYQKTNIAEASIRAALLRLGPEVRAYHINQQDDPNHWDIHVLMRPNTFFIVQSKWLSQNNLQLQIRHLKDWLSVTIPTIPIWWEEETNRAYWADPLKFLLRTGGTLSRVTGTFDRDRDLNGLNIGCFEQKQKFLRRVRELCSIWPYLKYNTGLSLADSAFPVAFIDVVEDPDILRYLPASGRLVDLVCDYTGGKVTRTQIARDVLGIARQALRSSDDAIKQLLDEYGIPEGEQEFVQLASSCLLAWRDRIPKADRVLTAKTLWGFEKSLSLVDYGRCGDVQMVPFSAGYTYPIGRIVNLLPPSVFSDPLLRILGADEDYQVLQFAAWCFGILNHSVSAEPWREIKAHRLALRRDEKRRKRIGENWRFVDRQLLYAEAQLGSEEARFEYLRRLSNGDAAHFESAYNIAYYAGDQALIRDRFERRLEEGSRTDANVRPILCDIYNYIRKLAAFSSMGELRIRPELWPTE